MIMQKLDFNNNGYLDYSEFMILHLNAETFIKEESLKEIF